MTEFTPVSAAIGGLLIGCAAGLLLLANGRIAGISDIVGGLLSRGDGQTGWRAAFVVGLPLGAGLAFASGVASVPRIDMPLPILIAAGLLVGFGTRLGSGCTSGHGVCGISRGSLRSFSATATFMLVGAACVFITRHVLGGSA